MPFVDLRILFFIQKINNFTTNSDNSSHINHYFQQWERVSALLKALR